MEEDKKILFYEGPYYMFSNFSAFAVELDGKLWMTTEHAYQAAKFDDPEIRDKICQARSAHDAKKIAKEHEHLKRPDWDEIKISVMERVVAAKADQHPYVLKKLLESEDWEIIEDSPDDDFWGRGLNHRGENQLGKIWMRERSRQERLLSRKV